MGTSPTSHHVDDNLLVAPWLATRQPDTERDDVLAKHHAAADRYRELLARKPVIVERIHVVGIALDTATGQERKQLEAEYVSLTVERQNLPDAVKRAAVAHGHAADAACQVLYRQAKADHDGMVDRINATFPRRRELVASIGPLESTQFDNQRKPKEAELFAMNREQAPLRKAIETAHNAVSGIEGFLQRIAGSADSGSIRTGRLHAYEIDRFAERIRKGVLAP